MGIWWTLGEFSGFREFSSEHSIDSERLVGPEHLVNSMPLVDSKLLVDTEHPAHSSSALCTKHCLRIDRSASDGMMWRSILIISNYQQEASSSICK